MNKTNLVALLLILTVIAAVLWPLFLGRFYGTGDMRDVFIPLEHFFHAETVAGRLPAWNPNIAFGYPAIASAQIGYFYPPLLLTRWLPLPIYMPLIFAAHLLWLAIGMFFFLRQQKLSRQAAVLGSLAMSLSAWVALHTTHLNIIIGSAWLPWQFLAATNFIQRRTARNFAWLAAALSLPILAGQFQIPFLMILAATAWLITQTLQKKSPGLSSVKIGISLAIIVLAAAMIQIWPTLELANFSSRGASGSFSITQANQHSFPLYHLPTYLFPRFFGHNETYWGKRLEIEYGCYLGAIPLLLMLFYLRIGRKRARFWKWLAGLSLLAAFGGSSPFRLVGLEPSLWFFSAPARWLLLATFGLSVLAALGFDAAVADKKKFYRFALKIGGTAIAAVAIFNIFLWLPATSNTNNVVSFIQTVRPTLMSGRPQEYYADKLNQIFASARSSSASLASIYTIIPIIALAAAPWLVKKPGLLLAAAAAELIIFAGTASPTQTWRDILAQPNSISDLPDAVIEGQARLLSITANGDSGLWLTNPSSSATDLVRATQREAIVPLLNAQFDIPGASWPASLDIEKVTQQVSRVLAADSGNLNYIGLGSLNIGAIAIDSNLPQPKDLQLLAQGPLVNIYEIKGQPRASLQGASAPAYRAPSSGEVVIEAQSTEASKLIIRNTWFPGWQATVNGQATEIKASGIFQSIDLPAAGTYAIKLAYRPRWLTWGLAISILAWIALGIAWLKPQRVR